MLKNADFTGLGGHGDVNIPHFSSLQNALKGCNTNTPYSKSVAHHSVAGQPDLRRLRLHSNHAGRDINQWRMLSSKQHLARWNHQSKETRVVFFSGQGTSVLSHRHAVSPSANQSQPRLVRSASGVAGAEVRITRALTQRHVGL